MRDNLKGFKNFTIFISARTSDIIQIACVHEEETFDVYIKPTCNISIPASNATGQ